MLEIALFVVPLALAAGALATFVAYAGRSIDIDSTSTVYGIPKERLRDTTWGINQHEGTHGSNLIYAFRGSGLFRRSKVRMEAVFWLGSNRETERNAARLLVQYANKHKLDNLPKINELVRQKTGEWPRNVRASPSDVLCFVQVWHAERM